MDERYEQLNKLSAGMLDLSLSRNPYSKEVFICFNNTTRDHYQDADLFELTRIKKVAVVTRNTDMEYTPMSEVTELQLDNDKVPYDVTFTITGLPRLITLDDSIIIDAVRYRVSSIKPFNRDVDKVLSVTVYPERVNTANPLHLYALTFFDLEGNPITEPPTERQELILEFVYGGFPKTVDYSTSVVDYPFSPRVKVIYDPTVDSYINLRDGNLTSNKLLTHIVGQTYPTFRVLEITENGNYNVIKYDRAVVEVKPKLSTLTVTENGTFTPQLGTDGFSSVTVKVESSTPSFNIASINTRTENVVFKAFDLKPTGALEIYPTLTFNGDLWVNQNLYLGISRYHLTRRGVSVTGEEKKRRTVKRGYTLFNDARLSGDHYKMYAWFNPQSKQVGYTTSLEGDPVIYMHAGVNYDNPMLVDESLQYAIASTANELVMSQFYVSDGFERAEQFDINSVVKTKGKTDLQDYLDNHEDLLCKWPLRDVVTHFRTYINYVDIAPIVPIKLADLEVLAYVGTYFSSQPLGKLSSFTKERFERLGGVKLKLPYSLSYIFYRILGINSMQNCNIEFTDEVLKLRAQHNFTSALTHRLFTVLKGKHHSEYYKYPLQFSLFTESDIKRGLHSNYISINKMLNLSYRTENKGISLT